MAFGKKPLPQRVVEKLHRAYEERVASKDVSKPLKVPFADTPLGEVHMIAAVEDTISATARLCPGCRQTKNDLGLSLTGTCTTCWAKQKE